MDEDEIKEMPINELRQEEGASELASSPDMEPYLNYVVASMQSDDVGAEEMKRMMLKATLLAQKE